MGFSVENGGFLLKYGVNMVFLLVFNRFPGKMGENNPSWGPLEGLGPPNSRGPDYLYRALFHVYVSKQ